MSRVTSGFIRTAKPLFERDEYAWLEEQAALLEASRLYDIDRASLAEFLRDMAEQRRDEFESAMTVLLHHMLKVMLQPERMSRSWALTIVEHRQRAQRIVKRAPGMRQHLPRLYADAYPAARERAAIETGIRESEFPAENPWTLDQALAYVPPELAPHPSRPERRR